MEPKGAERKEMKRSATWSCRACVGLSSSRLPFASTATALSACDDYATVVHFGCDLRERERERRRRERSGRAKKKEKSLSLLLFLFLSSPLSLSLSLPLTLTRASPRYIIRRSHSNAAHRGPVCSPPSKQGQAQPRALPHSPSHMSTTPPSHFPLQLGTYDPVPRKDGTKVCSIDFARTK